MEDNFTNIAGGPFQPYVSKQIEVRKSFLESSNNLRTNEHILYQNNRNGWIRLTSSVDVKESHPIARKYNMSGNNIAKNYILQGGLVKNEVGGVSLRSGVHEDGNYGMLKNRPLGIKPMPGVTMIDISSAGKLGTLQYANVSFTCYDLEQLEIMEALYMKLGFTVIIEWGHTYYLNNVEPQLSKPIPLDVFSFTSKEDLMKSIQQKRIDHSGNYDAMMGTISNFTWDAQKDGSYLCSIKLVGAGDILESLKINQSITPNTNFQTDSKFKAMENEIAGYDHEERKSLTSLVGDRDLSLLNRALFDIHQYIVNGTYNRGVSLVGITNAGYSGILNNIFSNSPYKLLSIDNGELVSEDEIALRGNHYSLLSNLQTDIQKIPKISKTLFNSVGVKYKVNDSSSSTDIGGLQPQTYITLGNLLAIMTCTGMIYDSKDGNNGNPYIYIDFNDHLNYCSTFKGQISINPKICLIPRNQSNLENPFGLGIIEDRVFNAINNIQVTKDVKVSFASKSEFAQPIIDVSNIQENNSTSVSNSYLNNLNNDVRARLMHILVNINFIADTLKTIRDNDPKGVVSYSSFLNALLSDISKSLGGFNAFRVLVDDSSKSMRIIDDNKTFTSSESSDDLNYTEIPLLGNQSIVYNYSFKSKIGPKMASMVTIAAQAEPSTLGEDSFAISNLSRGLEDRLMPNKLTSEVLKKKEEDPVVSEDSLKSLKTHMNNILVGGVGEFEINETLIEPSYNTYKEIIANFLIKEDSKNKGKIIVPLDFSITMDGLSGIIPNSAFVIPVNLLPSTYKTLDNKPKIAFIIHTINQEFTNNKWITKITGQTINIRFDVDDIIESKPIYDEVRINKGPEIGDLTVLQTSSCTKRASTFFKPSTVNIPIGYLKKAAQDIGLVSPQAIASLIAIASGECGLNPQNEGFKYSLDRIKQIFPYLSAAQYKRATAPSVTKKEFFEIVYGEYNPGRVGNRNKADGGKYYGRGYIQLTGYGNYKRYADLSKVDIVKNPDLVNDPIIGAKIAAIYFNDRVKVNQFDSNYFQKALMAVGYNVGDIRAKKIEYYNCYLNKM